MFKNRALFLDRDGVVNVDTGFVSKAEDFMFMRGLFPVLRDAGLRGYHVFIVTNQSGIARRYYDEATFRTLCDWMETVLAREGIVLAAIFFCPFLAGAQNSDYDFDSFWRKPGPGMFLEAAQRFSLDLGASLMVGDKTDDALAAQSAGIGRTFILGVAPLPEKAIRLGKLEELGAYLAS